jgi:small-conductance mechanosensitive channel
MANPTGSDNISIYIASLTQEFQGYFHQHVFLQIGIIAVTYLLATLLARNVGQHLVKNNDRVQLHKRFVLGTDQFTSVLRHFIWLVLVWFFHTLFKHLELPLNVLHLGLLFVSALLVVRFASFYIKSAFWSRFVYITCLLVVALRVFKLWDPAVRLLDSMTISLGSISFSLWDVIEAITIFILMWTVAGTVNRLLARWLVTSTKLTYSDRTLIQRVMYAVMLVVVVLIALSAAGIHPAAIAATGGAFGFAIGLGLQKIGSNMVAGMMLLMRKPIRQGDVIAFAKSATGSDYGWITEIGLLYVRVATRNGSLLLMPNEDFLTQKIENLSYDDNLIRLDIPFIAYKSDLDEAKTLALSVLTSIPRILKYPEPTCQVTEYGDSTVNMQLRIWINDPRNGIASVKDTVFMAVWNIFHANDIEISFPQRDLHIKSSVPFIFSQDKPQPDEKDSPAGEA